jgi:hypothetical protein
MAQKNEGIEGIRQHGGMGSKKQRKQEILE